MLVQQHLCHHIELKSVEGSQLTTNRENGRNTRTVENVVFVFWTNTLLQYDAFASLKNESNYSERGHALEGLLFYLLTAGPISKIVSKLFFKGSVSRD